MTLRPEYDIAIARGNTPSEIQSIRYIKNRRETTTIKIINRRYPNSKDTYIKGFVNDLPTNDFGWRSIELYRRPDGIYYIHAEGGPMTTWASTDGNGSYGYGEAICIISRERDIKRATEAGTLRELEAVAIDIAERAAMAEESYRLPIKERTCFFK